MTDSLARRVHELLTHSIEMGSDQRRQFLQDACAADVRLADQLERMLHAIDDSRSFLERPALDLVPPEFWQVDTPVPERIGDYRIVRQLGTGGMGAVYEAIQNQPQRPVALKIPRRRQWNTNLQQQLQLESEILGRLRHPHIAQVYEAGIDRSDPASPIAFFAMEFVPGAQSLGSYVRQHQLGIEGILQIVIKVCDAIQHGHRLGIIHRDLKPGNILVDADGNPKVIDFGVASSREHHKPQPATADARPSDGSESDQSRIVTTPESPAPFGTLNYMSPEQCDGQEFLDARTDIYSLGVVLYQMLCDSLPHDLQGLTTAQAIQHVQQQPIRDPTRIGQPLHRDLQAILRKALAKNREQRYSTIEALGQDLQRYLHGFPVAARTATLGYVGLKFVHRHRWLVGAGVMVLLAIAAGVVASSIFAYRTAVESARRREAEKRALLERDDAIWQSYVANLAAGFGAFQNGELAQLRTRLAAAPTHLRNWEWHYLAGLAGSGERVITAHGQMIQALAISDDGSLAVTGAEDGHVRIWNAKTWELLVDIPRPIQRLEGLAHADAGVTAVAFRHGNRQVVSGMTDGSLRIWDAQTGTVVRELAGHGRAVMSLSVHPNGLIASGCWGNRGRLWDGDSANWLTELNDEQHEIQGVLFCDAGQRLLTWEPNGSICVRDTNDWTVLNKLKHPGNLRRVAASGDASLVAAGGIDNRVFLFRLANSPDEQPPAGPVILNLVGNRSSTDSLCFSGDGAILAVGRVDRRIELISLHNNSPLGRLRGHEEFVSGLAFNHDASQLVSASGDGTIRIWPLGEQNQLGNVKVSGHGNQRLFDVAISPDGTRIASAGEREVALWDHELRPVALPLTGHRGQVLAVAWSPGQGVLAWAGSDRIVRLSEIDSGQTTALPGVLKSSVRSLAFSPNGRFVIAADLAGAIRVWDTEREVWDADLTIRPGEPTHQAAINRVCFSRDGRLLASASDDRTIQVWDFEKRELIHDFRGQHMSDVFAVVFSPEGDVLYSGSRDRTIAVWSLATGDVIETLVGHGQLIRCLDISPDGTRLVAGSWFGDVSLWDIPRYELVATFKGHLDIIHGIAFDPTGKNLVTCSYDRTVRLHQTEFQGRE